MAFALMRAAEAIPYILLLLLFAYILLRVSNVSMFDISCILLPPNALNPTNISHDDIIGIVKIKHSGVHA